MSSIYKNALIFSLPGLGLALLQIPVMTVLGGIYAQNFGLTLTAVAGVMLMARLVDAISDPIVGYYSDRWRDRTGSRKLFISLGIILLIPSSFFFLSRQGL